eukprot:3151464-Rhodomonas_salina.1
MSRRRCRTERYARRNPTCTISCAPQKFRPAVPKFRKASPKFSQVSQKFSPASVQRGTGAEAVFW